MRNMAIVILALFALSLAFAGMALAAQDTDNGGLKAKVESYQEQGGQVLVDEVDRVGGSIVGFVRDIFAVGAVVFLMWAGIVAWGAGSDPNKWALVRKLAIGFVACLVLIFKAEEIVGGLLGLFGFKA